MLKKLISVPRLVSPTTQENTTEWQIPDLISVALSFVEKFGYTVMAKVKVEKKHWWERSWKTFATHAPTADEAVKKGNELLENYGYTIHTDSTKINF